MTKVISCHAPGDAIGAAPSRCGRFSSFTKPGSATKASEQNVRQTTHPFPGEVDSPATRLLDHRLPNFNCPACATRTEFLLALGAVAGFGGGFGGLPPGAVGSIPSDGRLQTGFEIGMHGPPAEFGTQLIGIDRVTSIMPRTVTHPVECVLRTPHKPQNHTHYGNVAHFAVRADQIRFADATARQNRPYRRRVVFRMNPVAHVLAGAVQFRPRAFQNGCDLSWNEFSTCWYGP